MVVATDALLLLTWAMHAYMPIALYLFVSRRYLSSIKYREPVPMGLAATFLTTYTLSVPPILCFGGTTTYTVILFFEWVVLLTGVVTYLLTQCILVVRFHITEILMHPVQATVPRVNQTKYLRWLLYPRFQLGLWVIFTILFNIPGVLQTHGLSITTQSFESDSNDDLASLRLTAGIETAVLIVASYFLARSMSRIVDNFGLKKTYVLGARVMACGVALYGLASALIAFEVAPGLETYHIPTIIGLHTAHIIFVMTIVLPLRMSYIAKETHKDLKARIRPNKREVDQLESMVLYRYLSTDEGFADFLAFSKKELYADTILAWKEVQKYKEGLVSIEHIYHVCLDASSTLQVNIAAEVRQMYEIQRPMVCAPSGSERRNRSSISLKRFHMDTVKTMHLSSVAPLDARPHHAANSPSSYTNIEEISRKSVAPPKSKFEKLFHPLGAEFLRIIYTEILPRFEQHASTAQWVAFRNREKAMLSLDAIEHMIDGTIDHGADIAQRGSMPCIADLQRIIPHKHSVSAHRDTMRRLLCLAWLLVVVAAETPAICLTQACYFETTECNRTVSPCPTCLTQGQGIVMCTDATEGCSQGTVCQPLVTNATLPLDMFNLTSAPTTIPPEASKSTYLYAILCGGLVCLVFVLYGVLRWIQKQKKRDAKLDSECTAVTSEANGYHASTDAGNDSDKLASLHGNPTTGKSTVEPQWKYGGPSVHDDPATYSMFHTVGRISNGKHGASTHFSFSQRKDDSIIYIMEDEDPKLRPSED